MQGRSPCTSLLRERNTFFQVKRFPFPLESLSLPKEKPHRRECATDQKIDGNIIKPPPQAFHRCPPIEAVIQAAHQEHHNKTDAVNQGSVKLHLCIGAYQQQDKSCNPQKRADPMSHRIPDFLQDRPFRRFLPDCVITILHFIPPGRRQARAETQRAFYRILS